LRANQHHFKSTQIPADKTLPENDWKPEDDEFKVDGRPVRWFLASDSKDMRDMATHLYGSKLIMVEIVPKHIAFVQAKQVTLADTFAEWYLLGLGDKIVANRISPRMGDFYTGLFTLSVF